MKTETDLAQESAPSVLLPLFPVGVRVSRVSLELTEQATEESIAATESLLVEVGQSHQYLLGDYANHLRRTQGKKVARAWMNRTHSPAVASAAAWVCSRVTPARRLMAASFGHAEAVSKLEATDQEVWLTRAFDEEWSVRQLRAEVRQRNALAKDAPPQRPVDQAAARASEAWEIFAAWYEANAPGFSLEQRAGWRARLFPFVAQFVADVDEATFESLAEGRGATATA